MATADLNFCTHMFIYTKHVPQTILWVCSYTFVLLLVLAVGSQSGSVSLYNVEKGQLMNKFVADAAVTCLSWAMLEEEGATLEEEGESV